MSSVTRYSKGRTINNGNFESTRIDIGIELECEDGQEDETYARLKGWVDNRIRQETNK